MKIRNFEIISARIMRIELIFGRKLQVLNPILSSLLSAGWPKLIEFDCFALPKKSYLNLSATSSIRYWEDGRKLTLMRIKKNIACICLKVTHKYFVSPIAKVRALVVKNTKKLIFTAFWMLLVTSGSNWGGMLRYSWV